MGDGLTGTELKQLLTGKPFIGIFDDDELESLAKSLQPVTFEVGNIIYEAGDPGNALDILESGRVHAVGDDGDGGEVILGTLTRGDHFGEQSLFGGERHRVTLRAAGAVTLWRLTREHFAQLLQRHRALRPYVSSYICDFALQNFIKRCTVFSPLNYAELRKFVLAFEPLECDADTVLVREGEVGDAFYLIREGDVEVVQGGAVQKTVNRLRDGDFFGELALLTDGPTAGGYRRCAFACASVQGVQTTIS